MKHYEMIERAMNISNNATLNVSSLQPNLANTVIVNKSKNIQQFI